MQDNAATGCIFIGPPGAAKSAMAKATGNEAGIPTISLDIGSMKGSLVGESEQRFRTALKVVDAVSQKRSLFIATCNSIGILPPELRRRFTFGTFFFDLPVKSEREAIWTLYRAKYGVAASGSTAYRTMPTGLERRLSNAVNCLTGCVSPWNSARLLSSRLLRAQRSRSSGYGSRRTESSYPLLTQDHTSIGAPIPR